MRTALVTLMIGTALVLGMLWGYAVYASSMTDDFNSYTANATITDDTTYNFGTFPAGGSSGPTNPSTKWEMDTLNFVAKTNSSGVKWGYLPNTIPFWRLNTQQTTQDSVITWIYKRGAGTNTAVDVWLRFQTQYQTYALQFDRDDNCMVVKRKMPSNDAASGQWGGIAAGRGAEIVNKGVYYVLRLDTDTPAHTGGPCNQDGTHWTDLTMGTSSITHNGTLNGGTQYTFKATITTVPAGTGTCTSVSFDCAQIQLFRGGVLVASWTDKNNGLSVEATRTLQQDCNSGYYTTVSGYTSSWCLPIYAAGKSGFRNDDPIDVWIDDFSMTEAGSAPAPTTPVVKSAIALKSATLRINTGTVRMH